jgi:hypothetical protein
MYGNALALRLLYESKAKSLPYMLNVNEIFVKNGHNIFS